jgi:hypothetical protein
MSTATTATQEPAKRARRGGSVPKAPSAGPIESGSTYSLRDFKLRTGWSNHALRTAKRNGLKVVVAGGMGFVRGADFADYIEKLATAN